MIARTMFCAPTTLVMNASTGWYSQVGTCFIAAAWKTTSAPCSERDHGGVVADVADAEVQPLMALLVVDDVVGRDAAVLEREPHRVLKRLAAGEDDDLRRHAELSLEQAAHQHLAERAGPAGDDDALTGEQGSPSIRVAGAISASSATISAQLGGSQPVASRKRLESRLRSTTTLSSGSISIVELERVAKHARAGRICRSAPRRGATAPPAS